MNQPAWRVRPAREKDRSLLERFSCADPAIAWQVEVEEFVRNGLLDWAFAPLAQEGDPRLLLLFDRKSKALVGLGAHERSTLQFREETPIAATKLEVAALARSWQGRRFASGERASDVLMSAVMTDVQARVPKRYARVFAVVHEDNTRSIRLCERFGLVEELSRPHPRYRRLVTAQRK